MDILLNTFINLFFIGLFMNISVIIVVGCLFLVMYFLPDDNVIEESLEEIVKEKVGVDVDLTPNSPEKE